MRVERRLGLALLVAGCGGPSVEPGEELLGGDFTVFEAGPEAYSFSGPPLSAEERQRFTLGNSIFNRTWVTAPASAEANDGLGPLFNAHSCSACHLEDGRGAPPASADEPFLGLLLRLSVPGPDGPTDEPRYGGQLQHRAVLGVPPEGRPRIDWEELPGSYGDGEPYSLRSPTYVLDELAYGPVDPDALLSPRVATSMIGLGLLEAVPEASVLALADPDDGDGDGISGRPNHVPDLEGGGLALGRFGWKANQVSLRQQAAGAFLGDIGVTTSLHPSQGCTAEEFACLAAPDGGEPELDDERLGWVTLYARTLAVPARRGWDAPEVLRGRELFRELGCAACHTPKLETGPHEVPSLGGQLIRPYTDLLVHDLGEGLADGRPDGEADGREWRTAPLWGLGLMKVVSEHELLLHDGRARGAAEAVLWHGGEAEASRERFRLASAADRAALLAFLASL